VCGVSLLLILSHLLFFHDLTESVALVDSVVHNVAKSVARQVLKAFVRDHISERDMSRNALAKCSFGGRFCSVM